MAKQVPGLPCGKEMFSRLLPWAASQNQYLPEQVHRFCTAEFGIDEQAQRLRHPDSGKPVWSNYVAFALKDMTSNGLHIPPKKNDGIHYKPNPNAIRAYLSEHHPAAAEPEYEPLVLFIAAIKGMPRSTEAERLVVQRIGQDIFRAALLNECQFSCPISGLDHASLLRASHIKSWSCCDSDEERLDVNNGLLLGAHIDAAFDVGLISFDRHGGILLSPALSAENRKRLSMHPGVKIPMSPGRERYMAWHRQRFDFPDP